MKMTLFLVKMISYTHRLTEYGEIKLVTETVNWILFNGYPFILRS